LTNAHRRRSGGACMPPNTRGHEPQSSL